MPALVASAPVHDPFAPLAVLQVLADEARLLAAGVAVLRLLLIMVVALMASRLLQRLIDRVLGRMEQRAEKRDAARMQLRTETLGGVLRGVATTVVVAIAALMILDEFGVSLGPLIAGAGIVGVALGFGAQKLVQDFLSGIFMLAEDQFGVGDVVDTGEATGTIEAMTLRLTRLRDVNGAVWYVPNGEIRRVANFSQDWARAVLDVGIAYEADLDRATAVLQQAAEDLADDAEIAEHVLAPPEVWGVQDLGDDEVTVRVAITTAPSQQWAVARALRARVKQALDAAGLEIPYPQRTVWLRAEDPVPDAEAGGPAWQPVAHSA